jgi:hypothetical protein
MCSTYQIKEKEERVSIKKQKRSQDAKNILLQEDAG